MIARILIRQLYDTYNYDIQFPENQRVTIITGPNGYGKTTYLKIINNLLTCNFWFFYLLKFKEIQIFFRNGMNISIQKKRIEAEDNNREDRTPASLKEKVFFRLNANESDEAYIEEFSLSYSDILRLRRQLLPTLSYRQTEEYDIEELLNKEYNIDSDISILEKSKNIRMFLQERKCSFIKEQRIIASTQHSGYDGRRRLLNQFEIDDIAAQLIKEFAKQQMEFASESQKIDSTFIKRLVEGTYNKYKEAEFQEKPSKLKAKINNYKEYGLMPQIDILEEYPEHLQNVLSLYIDDMEQKMSSFDKFYKQLSLFDRFVSGKVLSNKKIKLNEVKGVSVINDKGEEVPLRKLSSGEQNLIILYYKLAFSTDMRTVLLIDEPENSLHMAWVSQMLEDYQKMAEELKCQIIIATHSPAFINEHWDISCDLYTNNEENNHAEFAECK